MPTLDPGGVVLFDAVGTLLRPKPSVAEAYAAAGRRFGSKLAAPEIKTAFGRIFAAEKAADLRDHAGRTGEPRERERWRSIVAGVFHDVPTLRHDALFEDLWTHFASPESWRLFDDVGPALAQLAAAGRPVAIASNFDSRLLGIVAALLPQIPPERVFVSSLVGHRKPAAEFFRVCERRLTEVGFSAASLTLIGDDPVEDFDGARAAGWSAVLLDRDDEHPAFTSRLRSLSDLV